MTMITEPPRLTGVLKFEEDPSYCREEVTVLAGSGSDRELKLGTVLGRITASGKVVELALSGSDGSQTIYGVLLANVTAPVGSDVTSVALVRGPAIVADTGLIHPAGATAPQKTTITSALIALGIVVRHGI